MNGDKRNKKRIINNPHENEMGKLPPQAVDIEEAVLGAVLLEDNCYHQVADMLIPEIFYKEQNGLICQAIVNLKNKGSKADLLTVTKELKQMDSLEMVGGAYYVSKLTDRVATPENIEVHMRLVIEAYIKREAIRSSTNLIRHAYEDAADCFDIIDEYEKNLTAITDKLFVRRSIDSASLLRQLLEHNASLLTQKGIVGVPAGFEDLDLITGGWQKSDMIVLAARPGMGKTALALQLAKNAAVDHKKPTAIFSLEMSSLQLYKRLCSQETEIPLELFNKGLDEATQTLLLRDIQALQKAPLFIDDTAALTIFELRNRARKMKRENNIELIIIDYLQLMSGGNEGKGNREQEISAISRGIKALAKELDIPIIPLSQLSREAEADKTKPPMLKHLRDSGSIEQDADMVIFIYRPDYYGIESDGEGNSTKGMAAIVIAKNRQGRTDQVNLKWKGDCVKFFDQNHSYMAEAMGKLEDNNDFLNI